MPQDFTTGQVLTAAQMDTLSGAVDGYATTATAAGTLTLTTASLYQQFFTGSTTHSVVMPVTTTLYVGQKWRVVNNSSGVVTVKTSDSTTIYAVPAGGDVIFTCILASGTTAASWDYKNHIATATTGGLTLIKRASFSGVANTGTTFDDIFTSTYTQYLIRIESLYATTGTDDFLMQLRYAGPTTETGVNYRGSSVAFNYSAGAAANTASPTSPNWLVATDIGETTYRGAGELNFTGVGNSSEIPQFWGRYTGGIYNVIVYGNHDVARIYTGILLKSSSTNITGTLSVYGLAKA